MLGSNPGVPGSLARVKNPDLKIADVMRTDFRSCNVSTPAVEVATALRLSRSHILPVTQAQVPTGVVTEHGLAMALTERKGDLSRLTAGDLMDREAPTISTDSPIEKAVGRIDGPGGYLLAVNDEGQLKGIVTLAELGAQLSEAALVQLVARTASVIGVPEAPDLGEPQAYPGRTPAQAAHAADPTAEIKSSKSQSQPHPWDSPTLEHPAPIPLVSGSDLINPMLKVADVMTADPRTCSPASTVLEAVLIFRDADCGLIPVVEEGRPVGVLTDRDVALALAEHETDLASLPVEELMKTDVVTIAADDALDVAIERLGDEGIRRLLVVDPGGLLVGVLSWIDLVPHLSERGAGQVAGRIARQR